MALADVRDLALAVVEGAVAAESLAKELKRTPDRSRHFQEIAERLRGVVGRPSIRRALSSPESAGQDHIPTPRSTPALSTLPTTPVETLASSGPVETEARTALESRFESRLEERLEQLFVRLQEAQARRDDGERYTLRSPEEALALAARLVERLRREARVIVRIETSG